MATVRFKVKDANDLRDRRRSTGKQILSDDLDEVLMQVHDSLQSGQSRNKQKKSGKDVTFHSTPSYIYDESSKRLSASQSSESPESEEVPVSQNHSGTSELPVSTRSLAPSGSLGFKDSTSKVTEEDEDMDECRAKCVFVPRRKDRFRELLKTWINTDPYQCDEVETDDYENECKTHSDIIDRFGYSVVPRRKDRRNVLCHIYRTCPCCPKPNPMCDWDYINDA